MKSAPAKRCSSGEEMVDSAKLPVSFINRGEPQLTNPHKDTGAGSYSVAKRFPSRARRGDFGR